jgi:hypothetical protein
MSIIKFIPIISIKNLEKEFNDSQPLDFISRRSEGDYISLTLTADYIADLQDAIVWMDNLEEAEEWMGERAATETEIFLIKQLKERYPELEDQVLIQF